MLLLTPGLRYLISSTTGRTNSMWALTAYCRFNLVSGLHLLVSTFVQPPNLGGLTLGGHESLISGEWEWIGKCLPFSPSNKWYTHLKGIVVLDDGLTSCFMTAFNALIVFIPDKSFWIEFSDLPEHYHLDNLVCLLWPVLIKITLVMSCILALWDPNS